ncbi:unnamed protein product [Darwinula stevensoni]|uniref:Uncharacterized protein n=1 Tax=Darwinula stevensoni TaxID=69355 RepID=A0A7R9A8F7_9CRUS|nr:unnamed protein product [Darwinula stevensoni]CAG0896311.1 unnamed protein product [Darwinula stevensoni]
MPDMSLKEDVKVIVIIIIWIIAILVLYMIFLMVLDPILSKRKQDAYVEHTNEEEPQASTSEMPLRNRSGSNVFDRVGHQQVRWKQQVQEQRRNIYDRHVMLN